MLWSWQQVTSWFMDKGKLDKEAVYENAVVLKQINESLEMRENEL